VTEIVVYAVDRRAAFVRSLLASGCQSLGIQARLELFSSGSVFQRLRARRRPPPPDLVVWWGPFAAHAAALTDLLQPHQPAALPQRAVHDGNWRWVAVDFQWFSVVGSPAVSTLQDLQAAARVSMADPERSEIGMAALLAVLDQARQAQNDVEQGWSWWQRRVLAGATLTEDDATALDAQRQTRVSHALTLGQGGAPLKGLAPLPHAIGLASGSRNVDDARRLLDWLVGPQASAPLSAWQADSNGVAAALDAAPPLDVDWATRQYASVRARWAKAGFGPSLGA
jgi:ABC-type Fe3+ transport system substrate-binding protein